MRRRKSSARAPLPWSTAADIERRSIADLKKICKRPLNFKPAETLRAYLAGPDQKSLLPSCASRRAADEQSSGAVAQAHGDLRKVCFGTRSARGLKTHSILPSLVQTARRQGVHPREFLKPSLRRTPPRHRRRCITIPAERHTPRGSHHSRISFRPHNLPAPGGTNHPLLQIGRERAKLLRFG